MLQRILGTIAAIVAVFGIVALGELLLHALFPMPAMDVNDPASVEAAIRSAPLMAKLGLVLLYGLAAYVGGLVGCLASRWIWGGRIAVALLLAAVVANVLMLPHPLWMVALSIGLVLFGGWIGIRAGIGQYVLAALRRD